jgi:hypothetical protein
VFKRALQKTGEWLLAIIIVGMAVAMFMWFGVLILIALPIAALVVAIAVLFNV